MNRQLRVVLLASRLLLISGCLSSIAIQPGRAETKLSSGEVAVDSFRLWTTYTLQKGALQGLGFGFGVFYVGDRQGNLTNTFKLPSYLRTDAALFYKRTGLPHCAQH